MALDPSIPLQVRPPNIQLPNPNQGITLANMAMQMRSSQQQYQMREMQMQQQNALRQILSAPGSVDASGDVTPEARQRIMAADPAAGMAIQKNSLLRQEAQSRINVANIQVFQKKAQAARDLNGRALATYEDAIKNGTPDAQARVLAQQAYTDGISSLSSSGIFSKDDIQRINPQFDPQRMRANAMNFEQWQAQQDKQRQEAETARHHTVQEQQGQKKIDLQMGVMPGGPQSANAGASGEAFLKTLDPALRLQVKALADGRMAFPSGFALRSPYWQMMLQRVAQYDPSFDAVNYNARAKTRNDFTSGKSAQNITSFNMAISHLGTLNEAVKGLKNTSIPVWNRIANAAETESGDPRVVNFKVAAQAVEAELTRAFRGTGGNESDILAWRGSLDAAGSPAQLRAAIKQGVKLLEGRISAVGQQYSRGMGVTADPLNLLAPSAIKTLRSLGVSVPKDVTGGLLDPHQPSFGASSPKSGTPPFKNNEDSIWAARHAASAHAAPAAGGAPVMTEQQYNAAPSGTRYRMPNDPPGQFRVKP